MTIGQKLKKLRIDNGFTQDELAEKLYVTRTAVSKWETDRGYPNIESLKAIARIFSVTVDELLSSDEVLAIAEEESRNREKRFRELVCALLDISVAMLLFLPFFAERIGEGLACVSLMALSSVRLYLKIAYFVVVIALILCGSIGLALRNCRRAFWLKSKAVISLSLGALSVLLFVISLQPYAAVYAFVTLSIKTLILLKSSRY